VADLTDEDAWEFKAYLPGTCNAIRRWLPGSEWSAGWQSEAARECANRELGPGGQWGAGPGRSAYIAAGLYLEAVLQCLRAMGDALTVDSTAYVVNTLARAAMESGSRVCWLLEPGIGARARVTRFVLIRASGARYLDAAVRKSILTRPAPLARRQRLSVLSLTGLACGLRMPPRARVDASAGQA